MIARAVEMRGKKFKTAIFIKSSRIYDGRFLTGIIWHSKLCDVFSVYTIPQSPLFSVSTHCLLCRTNHRWLWECAFCVWRWQMQARWKENLSAFRESKTMCEGLMDEGAADLTLCLRLSQVVSEELAYLRQCVSLRGRVVLFIPLTTRQCW